MTPTQLRIQFSIVGQLGLHYVVGFQLAKCLSSGEKNELEGDRLHRWIGEDTWLACS